MGRAFCHVCRKMGNGNARMKLPYGKETIAREIVEILLFFSIACDLIAYGALCIRGGPGWGILSSLGVLVVLVVVLTRHTFRA